MLWYIFRNKKTLCFIFVLLCILLSGCYGLENISINGDAGSGVNVIGECDDTLNVPSETEVTGSTKLTGIQEKVFAQVSAGERRNHLLEHIKTYKNVKDASDSGYSVLEVEDSQIFVAQKQENINLDGLLEEISAQTSRYGNRNHSMELIKEYKKRVR